MTEREPGEDAQRVRASIRDQLHVHVRLRDQNAAPDQPGRDALAMAIPALQAFGTNQYQSVTAVLDWDHSIPSEYALLRIYASYTDRDAARVKAQLDARTRAIDTDNLYPEFDLPDYGGLVASEIYVGVFEIGTNSLEEFRLMSEWRKQVSPEAGRSALSTVKGSTTYKKAIRDRNNDALGGAVVVGWAPPCAADTQHWAIEVWLITAFDGQMGTARVFMVDSVTGEITREHDTTVQVS